MLQMHQVGSVLLFVCQHGFDCIGLFAWIAFGSALAHLQFVRQLRSAQLMWIHSKIVVELGAWPLVSVFHFGFGSLEFVSKLSCRPNFNEQLLTCVLSVEEIHSLGHAVCSSGIHAIKILRNHVGRVGIAMWQRKNTN